MDDFKPIISAISRTGIGRFVSQLDNRPLEPGESLRVMWPDKHVEIVIVTMFGGTVYALVGAHRGVLTYAPLEGTLAMRIAS